MWPNPQFPADLVVFTEEILNGKMELQSEQEQHLRKFLYESLLNSVWLWKRAQLATNKKQNYFSLPYKQLG